MQEAFDAIRPGDSWKIMIDKRETIGYYSKVTDRLLPKEEPYG